MSRAKIEAVIRQSLRRSIGTRSGPITLLLSGGLDSSIIGALAAAGRRDIRAITFGVRLDHKAGGEDSDLEYGALVAKQLGIEHECIHLRPDALVNNVPQAIFLGETARGSIVEPCAGLIEVGRTLRRRGIAEVWIGEAADDLFGGFSFARRYYQGSELRAHYRRELTVGLPDEFAILQKLFADFGVSLFDPYWSTQLLELAYSLPLKYLVESKPLLRSAFARDLQPQVLSRPKGVTRDATGIRSVLEKRFGRDRWRYYRIYKGFFGRTLACHEELLSLHLRSVRASRPGSRRRNSTSTTPRSRSIEG